MAEPKVVAIVLNWNASEVTEEGVRSLLSSDYEGLEILLVDNGSTDGSVQRLRKVFPQLELIVNGSNLGFAGGNNVGLRRALEKSPDYVLLFNNDAEADRAMVASLVRAAEERPDAGILVPRIYFHAERDRLWSAGAYLRDPWDLGLRGSRRRDDGSYDERCEVDWATGCIMLVRRRVVEAVGPMDDAYFLQFEDLDWCVRAQKAGWKVVYEPTARAWHKVSLSVGGLGNVPYYYYFTRNQFRFIERHIAPDRRWAAYGRATLRQANWLASEFRRDPRRFPAKVLAALHGSWDFLRGRFGPRFGT